MIASVAIFGAGTMGGGIAITCLKAGLPVVVIDTGDAALDRLRQRVSRHLAGDVERGRMTAAAATTAAAVLQRPERMLGLHYFSPAEISPVVELISTEATRADVLVRASAFLASTGKSPLPCKDSPGFALNRFFCPYCNAAVRCLDAGLGTSGQIDRIARETFGLAAGPFRVMNLTKPVIMLKSLESLAPLGPVYEPAAGLIAIGARREDWQIEAEPAALPEDRARPIAERLLGAVLLPALAAMAEGVVSAANLDRGARAALRFERTPVTLRDSLPPGEVERLVAGHRAI